MIETKDTGGEVKIIDYHPGPTMMKAHRSTARVKCLWGPIRTGKSTGACWRVFFMAIEAAKKGIPLRTLILRDTFRNLEDTTLKTWMEWFGSCGRLVRRQNVVDFHLNVPGTDITAEILFRHGQTASDASSFLSSEYGLIVLEEAVPAFTASGTVSPGIAEEVFDIALQRLVQKGIENPELVISCNTPTPQHWVYRRIIGMTPERLKELNWWHFMLPKDENEMNLRKGFYDELEVALAGKDHLLKRFIRGEIVAIYPGMPVFSGDFSQRTHVSGDLRPIPSLPFILGFDFGLTPAAVWTQIDAKGRWLWHYELQGGFVDGKLGEQIGIEKFAQAAILAHNERYPGMKVSEVIVDPAGFDKAETDEKTCRYFLEKAGFKNVRKGRKDIASRIEAIRNRLNLSVGGEPGLLINRYGCPLLIEGLSGGYRWKVSRDQALVHGNEPLKNEFSHLMDAVGYVGSRKFAPLNFASLFQSSHRIPPSPFAA